MREAVITQFAPVNAGVIECMQKFDRACSRARRLKEA